MATGLFSRIEAEFKRSVPLGSLFRAQTIAELAVTLTNAPVSDSYRSTLVIESGKSRRPTLFLVHGMDGDVGHWRPLIEHLGSDIDVYGLKLPEIAGTYQPFSSLEAMAAYHVERIYQTQPDGPYHIAGYSFGGRVALEIAQQLVSAGRPVGLLVAIDSGPFPQSKYDWKSFSLYRFITNLYNWLADDLLKTPLRELLDRVRLKIKTSARRMGLLSRDLPASSPLHSLHSWLDLEHLSDQRRSLIETNYLAWQSYLPRAYPGRVTLFRARTRPLLHSLSPDLGWAEIAREGVDIRIIAGHHWSIMVEPNVQNLADQLRTCLKEAEPVGFRPTGCSRPECPMRNRRRRVKSNSWQWPAGRVSKTPFALMANPPRGEGKLLAHQSESSRDPVEQRLRPARAGNPLGPGHSSRRAISRWFAALEAGNGRDLGARGPRIAAVPPSLHGAGRSRPDIRRAVRPSVRDGPWSLEPRTGTARARSGP